MQRNSAKRIFGATVGIIAWFAVLIQLVLILQNRITDVPETLVRFFSFFTILTNIVVAVYLTGVAFQKQDQVGWQRSSTATAIAVYILVVGIVYNIILRQLWAPVGMQKLVDELLHVVVPLLYFVYWVKFVSPMLLPWRKAITWLLYPLVYLVFVLLRGSVSNYYPYPFLDVFNHGYQQVMVSSAAMLLLFLLLSVAFIAASRYLARKKVTV